MKKIKNNKGFTLVELIVVMAIMAILVGALAPQVVKYVEKARESKDLQVASIILTAFQTEIAGSSVDIADFSATEIETASTGYTTDLIDKVKDLSGFATNASITAALKSAKGKSGSFSFKYTKSSGLISVTIGTLPAVTNK